MFIVFQNHEVLTSDKEPMEPNPKKTGGNQENTKK